MSASLRDLTSRVEALRRPSFDADALIRQAEMRAGRRRIVTLGAAALAVALIGLGVATVNHGEDHSAPPAKQDKDSDGIAAASVRQVTYGGGYWPTTTLHYGNRTVDLPQELSVRPAETGVVHMDVTDDGVAFTIATSSGAGKGVWFTDGMTTQRIGRIQGYLGLRNNMAVVSGTAGSRLAWIEELKPGHAEIVVYDTHADREVGRVPAPSCYEFTTSGCAIVAVVGDDHVYVVVDEMNGRRDLLMRLEVSTGELERVTRENLAADLASMPRGLILGDSPDTGLVTNGYGVVFAVRGARLVAMRSGLAPAGRPRSEQDPISTPTKAFDTGTGRPLLFRLPAGYKGPDEYTAFQWLDDDRLALLNGANTWHGTNGDILGCRISTGQCEVVVSANSSDVRVVPHLPLPG